MAQGGEGGEPQVRPLIRTPGKKAVAHATAFVFEPASLQRAGGDSPGGAHLIKYVLKQQVNAIFWRLGTARGLISI
jgi:hypothetical protein